MRKSTVRRIEKLRQKLIASVASMRDDPVAVAAQERAIDALRHLPHVIEAHVTSADAVIMTRKQLYDLLACFALDLVNLQIGGVIRRRRRRDVD